VKFVADESCGGPVIRALRQVGHDLIAIAEIARGSSDDAVMEKARTEGRVLITEDRDFGELVYARGRPTEGVVFLKFHSRSRHVKNAAVVEAVANLGERLRGAFMVIEPGRVRLARRPRS
jgi:predicted nuclease of predicted toxin-antitoxin system